MRFLPYRRKIYLRQKRNSGLLCMHEFQRMIPGRLLLMNCKNHYHDVISRSPNWRLIKIYADEGITGTSTKHREGFKKMVADALAGEIDLIVTKSVSRFARNTVDSLTTIRQLKEHGVECYFEKEKHLDFRRQGRAAHHHHELACAGGKPQHFRELHMGTEKALCRWGHHSV